MAWTRHQLGQVGRQQTAVAPSAGVVALAAQVQLLRSERGFPGWRFSDGAERLALGNGDNLELRAHTHASSLFAHAPTCSTCLADPHRAARPFSSSIIRRQMSIALNWLSSHRRSATRACSILLTPCEPCTSCAHAVESDGRRYRCMPTLMCMHAIMPSCPSPKPQHSPVARPGPRAVPVVPVPAIACSG